MPKDFLNKQGYPLGLRDNNPGNIRTGDTWKGMTGENNGFVVFANCSWGLRALAIDLRTKIGRGLNTLEKIIYQWAPPSENDTEAYINSMTQLTGIGRYQVLSATNNTLLLLMNGIVYVEIGPDFFDKLSASDFNEGIAWMDNPPGTVDTTTAAAGFGGSIILFLGVLYLVTRPNKPKPVKSTRTRSFQYS